MGASSDIGWSVAEKLNENGYEVILAGRDVARIDEKRKGSTLRSTFVVQEFDAKKFDTHQSWFSSLPLVPDVVVCVFGYLGEQSKAEREWSEAQNIIESNYTGAVSILNVVAAAYSKQKKGTIVGISSVGGDRGRQSNFIYGSAKAGFTAYLSGLRNKFFAQGIHVATIKPGFVNTKMTTGLNLPKLLTAQPQQVAQAVLHAIEKKKNVTYVLPVWFLIMLIIKNIPEAIFKRLKL